MVRFLLGALLGVIVGYEYCKGRLGSDVRKLSGEAEKLYESYVHGRNRK
jgi:hypothetical protein